MKTSRRIAWLVLILGIGLFLGILFRGFILVTFVEPVAVVLLLLWRLVQSVHQVIYWGVLALATGGVAFYHLAMALSSVDETAPPAAESILKGISYWRTWILATGAEGQASNTLRRELRQMLIAIYASKTPRVTAFDMYESLRLRQIPLPANIYATLFPDEVLKTERSWEQRLQEWVKGLEAWVGQWTGRNQAEYYQTLEETLAFMETLTEIKHGDDYFNPTKH